MSRRTLFPSPAAWLALVSSFLVVSLANAQPPTPTSTWIATTSDNWSNPNDWSPTGAPVSPGTAPSTVVLQFNASGTTSYTATNDISDPFLLQAINFNSSSSGTITLAGNVGGTLSGALTFNATGSSINKLNNGTVVINNGINLTNTASASDVAIAGPGAGTIAFNGVLSGTGGINVTNFGGATVVLSNGTNTFGSTPLTGGAQVSGPGATLLVTAPSGTPLGSGGVEMSDGLLNIAPSGSGASAVISLSSTGGNLDLNAGGSLELNKGANTNLTFNIRALIRTTGGGSSGNIVIIPASGIASLGTATGETMMAGSGFAQGNVNGIIVPVVVAQASPTNTAADFMQYNATTTGGLTGFVQFQNYTNYTGGGSFSASTAGTEVSNVTGATTASANASVAALRVTGTTLTIATGSTVTLAGGTYSTGYNQSGLILNNNSTITGGTLNFGATEADVYVSSGLSTIASQITSTNASGSAPALVKFGPGSLLLTNTTNTFASGGTISVYGGNIAIVGPGGTNAAAVFGTGARPLVMRGGGFEVMNGNYNPPSGTISFTVGTSGITFQVDDTSTFTLNQASQLAPVAGAGPMIKTGTGTMVLANSGYPIASFPAILVNQGQLQINNPTSGVVPVYVKSSGTLAGNGSVGQVTVNSGGAIAPGLSGTAAALTTVGAVFQGGGIYTFLYNPATTSPTAGVDNSTISSSGGALDLTNLSVSNKFTVNLSPEAGTPVASAVTYTAGTFSSVALPTGFTLAPNVNLTSLFNFTGTFNGTPTAMLDATDDLLQFSFTPGGVTAFTWTGATSGNWSVAGNWSPAAVPPSAINTQLVFGATTHAAMTNDVGPLTLNSMTFNAGAPAYTLGGSASNALTFVSNSVGTLPSLVSNSVNGAIISLPVVLANNLNVSGSGNVTLAGAVSGASSINMNGTGILALTSSSNSFSGGVNINTGTVQVTSDAALGSGPITWTAAGTLAYAATTTTTKSFALNFGTLAVTAGNTLTFGGGQVTQGFLDGAGTFATSAAGSGTMLNNVTSTPSVAIVSNNSNDQFVHFTNGAAFSLAPGVNTAGSFTTTNLNGFTNQGLGSITIGAGSQLNVANFQSYGMTNLTPATVGGQFTELANLGTAPLGFNGGSQTFVGTAAAPNANVVGVDLHGQNMVIQGGLFVNNGLVFTSTGSSTIFVDYGATYKGAGTTNVPIVTQNGGKVLFGNSPGQSTFGSLTIGTGGIASFDWQINDAGPSPTHPTAPGVAGPTGQTVNGIANQVSGWSEGLVTIQPGNPPRVPPTTGAFSWTATPASQFDFQLETLVGPYTTVGTTTDGLMSDFDPTQPYRWAYINFQGPYAGPTTDSVLTADTLFDTTLFANTLPSGSSFSWDLTLNTPGGLTGGGELDLLYSPNPVPEPGTLALTGLVGLAAGWVARRRKNKTAVAKAVSV